MKSAIEDFNNIMEVFKANRALEFEKRYNSENDAEQKNKCFTELYDKILEIIDKSKLRLFDEYIDRVIELYNTDADYFYNRGFDDCEQIYSHIQGAIRTPAPAVSSSRINSDK